MTRQLWAAALTFVLCACSGGDTVEVTGKVTDQEGTQRQGVVRAAGGGLGGSGTVAATQRIRVNTVGPQGELTVVAETSVSGAGRYALEVPAEQERLVLQAVDGSGKVVASALLDATGEAGVGVVAPPMDSESSLEAEVFLQMMADGAQAAQTDTVDLRARINAAMAGAARQGASSAEATQARVKALAEAVRAAQEAEVRAYANAGVQTSQSALFSAELAAAAKLNEALNVGQSVEAAYQAFHAELAAAAERAGAKAREQARGESAASVAFRATVRARLSAQDAQPLVDAASRNSASLEARTTGVALQAVLRAAGASDAVVQQAAAASTELRAQVRASTTASAAAQAFASFEASVATSANAESTVLGSYLGVSASNQLALSGALQASASAAATLDAAVDAAALAAVSTSGTNVSLLATKTTDAYQAYATAVRAQAATLSVFGAKAAPAVEVLVLAEGSFQTY
jgi:hypothetical protein